MNSAFEPRREMSIFAPAQETAFYHYQRIQNKIKNIISETYNIGSKLPSINEFSQALDVSPNVIRKALNNLAKDGILRFARGRYGGTFVIDMPEVAEQAFRWLAVNPQYAKTKIEK
jgi:DNA-binding GntR family transcriptional regulator